jgi:hypothetical protein
LQRNHPRRGHGLDTVDALDALEEAVYQRGRLLVAMSGKAGVHAEDAHAPAVVARVGPGSGLQRAQDEPGGHEQDESERHLCGHQDVPKLHAVTIQRAVLSVECRGDIQPRGTKRRRQAEGH